MKKIILSLGLVLSGQVALQAQTIADLSGALWISDTRSQNEAPTFYKQIFRVDLKMRSTIGVPGVGGWSSNLTIAPWPDSSVGLNHQLNFNDGGIFYRTGSHDSPTWNAWQKVLIESSTGDVNITKDLDIKGDFKLGQNTSIGMPEYGKQICFLGAAENTDPLWMARYNRGDNLSDLRINIGDDNMDDDRLVVGRTSNNTFYPVFIVSNTGNLYLNGKAQVHEVLVETTNWADFVFNEDYNLRPLSEVSDFIQANKHLPEIPTATEVKNEGVNLGEMQTKLLQKVEELTLYLIQQDNTIKDLKAEIEELKNK